MPPKIGRRISDEKLSKATYDRMVRFSELRLQADRKIHTERQKRLDPVYNELTKVIRNSPEMAGVVRAIDSLPQPDKPELPPPDRGQKRRVIPYREPLVRADSIPYAFPPPYDTGNIWTDLEGGGNAWWSGPTADANTGEMGYEMKPGIGQSGSMACWVAVGLMLSVPRTPYTRIDFSVTTSLDWSYTEFSTTWRETKGNLWIGQYADLYDENGSFVENALATQNVIASWDDRNLFGNGGNKGSQNPVTIPLLQVSVPVAGSWDGGTIDYRCWLGGSGLADGSQQQSGCQAQMDAVCSQLVADIFF